MKLSPQIRYVALCREAKVISESRDTLSFASSAHSDSLRGKPCQSRRSWGFTKRRGDLGCCGLRFVIVAYGSFYQLVKYLGNGALRPVSGSQDRSRISG